MSMVVAFTGTREGMTSSQIHKVIGLLHDLPDSTILVHGGCVGADAEFHQLARVMAGTSRFAQKPTKFTIHIYPSTLTNLQAPDLDADFRHNHLPPLIRNKRMVEVASLLIATPLQHQEVVRSGTWATVRYAKIKSLKIKLVYPNGTVITKNESPEGD